MIFFGPSMTEKTMVEARGRKISGSSWLRWEVVAERCAFLSYTYARVCEALALTEPERGIGLELSPSDCRLRVTEPERSIDGC